MHDFIESERDGVRKRNWQLALLIGVEFWERYSFYGLRVLLVLFLTGAPSALGLGWSPGRAIILFSLFAGLSYLFPVVGGWLADRFFGARACVSWGGWMIVAGHLVLSAPLFLAPIIDAPSGVDAASALREVQSPIGDIWREDPLVADLKSVAVDRGVDEEAMVRAGLQHSRFTALSLFLGLALISLGTGLFKPSITTMVSGLYVNNHTARDRGYGFFYMGINAGTALGLLLCGFIGEKFGWHYGLLSAAIGFAPALFAYAVLAPKWLAHDVKSELTTRRKAILPLREDDWKKLGFIASYFPFAVIFWAGVEQFGGLLAIFSRDHVDRFLFGMEIPVAWVVLANPITIILLAPVLGDFWSRLEQRGANPLGIEKIGACLLFVALGYAGLALLSGGISSDTSQATISVMWIFLFYALVGVGEVLLQPVALAQIGRHAPARLESMMVGFWYLSLSVGGFLSGLIGSQLENQSFAQIFWWLCGLSLFGAAAAFMLRKPHRSFITTVEDAAKIAIPAKQSFAE